MTLQSWLLNDWLKPHKTSRNEVSDLFALIRDEVAAWLLKTHPELMET